MKIQGPKRTSESSATKKSSKAKVGDGGFGEFLSAGKSSGSAPASAPQSMTAVNSLLAVQGAEDPTERAARRRMTARADVVLEELDNLHMAVLRGNISMDHMMRIADKVSAHKERVVDKELFALLEEIDLRAQIELAKMRKALNAS